MLRKVYPHVFMISPKSGTYVAFKGAFTQVFYGLLAYFEYGKYFKNGFLAGYVGDN